MFPEKIEHEPNSQQAIHPALWGGRTKLALVKKMVPLGGPPDQHYYWFLVAYSVIAD
jgi:hypothetical protein